MGPTTTEAAAFLSDLPDWAAALFVVLLTGLLGSALAALLRAARLARGSTHAAAVVGGLLAGLLLGPVVLGVVSPQLHEGLYDGGLTEQDTLRRAVREQAGAIAALEVDGATPDRLDARRVEADRLLDPARGALDAARRSRARALDYSTLVLGGASLVLAFLGARTVRRDRARRPRARAIGPLAAAVPFIVAGGLLMAVGVDWRSAAVVGGLCSVGWMLVSHRAQIWRNAGRDVRTDLAAADALLLGGLAALPRTMVGLVAAGVLATPLAGRLRSRAVRRRCRTLAMALVLPACVAIATLRVDPAPFIGAWGFWLVVLIVLTGSTDSRWLGALLGWRIAAPARGWRGAHDGAVAYMLHGPGAGQACLASMALAVGAIDGRIFAAAVLSAGALELSAGLYRLAPIMFGFGKRDAVSDPA